MYCVNHNKKLDAQATECFNHPSANSCKLCSSSLYDCPLPDLQLYLEFHVPALLTHGPILTHAFLLLSHLLVSVCCGVPCTWIICCQGLCFCDCTPRAARASTALAKMVWSIRFVRFWLFLVFGFCLEKLLLPLVSPSKAGRSLSCVFDVICLRRTMDRAVFFLFSSTHYHWAPQAEEGDNLSYPEASWSLPEKDCSG